MAESYLLSMSTKWTSTGNWEKNWGVNQKSRGHGPPRPHRIATAL